MNIYYGLVFGRIRIRNDLQRRNRSDRMEYPTRSLPHPFLRPIFQGQSRSSVLEFFNSARILEQSMGARNRVGTGLSYRPARAGILKQSMGARNRVGIGLSYQPTRARICKPFKKPNNRFAAWRAGTTTVFVVMSRKRYKGWRNQFPGINSWAP